MSSIKLHNKIPPKELDSHELEIWHKFWNTKDKNVITIPIDVFLVCAFCKEMALYFRLREETKGKETFETESGYKQINPKVTLANTALKNAQSIGQEFGMTLKARKSLGSPVESSKEKQDPFAKAQ